MRAGVLVDVGSTVVKVARVNDQGELLGQSFFERDREGSIADQILGLLAESEHLHAGPIRICSSANGGLRVGIICLTRQYSGAVYRNQVLLAGANPVFVQTFDELEPDGRQVDMLLVGGGVDCDDPAPLRLRLDAFNPSDYRFGTLVYAGSSALADGFARRWGAIAIENPLAESLRGSASSVFSAVRDAYLDDLVYKEGVSELARRFGVHIRPTPEIVNRGFHRAVLQQATTPIIGSAVLLDIGGATTDVHYTVEIVKDESDARPPGGTSVARYVFTDLGIVASRDSTLLQLRSHPRLYEFLSRVALGGEDVAERYRSLREGTLDADKVLLSYACIFLALDRFSEGRGPGLPIADLARISQLILTGGAGQAVDLPRVASLIGMLVAGSTTAPRIDVDRDYRIWVDGMTWEAEPATAPGTGGIAESMPEGGTTIAR